MLGGGRTRTFDGQRYVVVRGPLSRAQQRLLDRHDSVQVDETDPPLRDLDVLTPWSGTLRRVLVTDLAVTDISALAGFTRLTELSLHTGVLKGERNRLPFGSFAHLRRFAATWYQPMETVFDSKVIESLMLENPPADVFERAAGMAALRTLDLRAARRVHAFPAPGTLPPLRHLKITMARFADLAGLAALTDLEALEFTSVTGLNDLSVLRHATHLRRLVLEDCGEVASLSFLAGLPLRELVLIGTTNVVDGDLRGVGAGLDMVAFPARSHYNATPRDLS